MKNAKSILLEYVAEIEKIIIEFSYNEENAAELLKSLKKAMEIKENVSADEKELFEVCIYNCLATINTSFEQEKKNNQLLMALTEAKEEMKTISELL